VGATTLAPILTWYRRLRKPRWTPPTPVIGQVPRQRRGVGASGCCAPVCTPHRLGRTLRRAGAGGHHVLCVCCVAMSGKGALEGPPAAARDRRVPGWAASPTPALPPCQAWSVLYTCMGVASYLVGPPAGCDQIVCTCAHGAQRACGQRVAACWHWRTPAFGGVAVVVAVVEWTGATPRFRQAAPVEPLVLLSCCFLSLSAAPFAAAGGPFAVSLARSLLPPTLPAGGLLPPLPLVPFVPLQQRRRLRARSAKRPQPPPSPDRSGKRPACARPQWRSMACSWCDPPGLRRGLPLPRRAAAASASTAPARRPRSAPPRKLWGVGLFATP
jgi:hypothetical protein